MIYASVEEAQAAVDAWNARHPVGQAVTYYLGGRNMPARDSTTNGPAYVMGTSAAVEVHGLSGAIGLGLVDPIPAEANGAPS